MGKNKDALDYLEKYLTRYAIKNQPMFANWKSYIINIVMPYEKGKCESGPFCLQWTCIIFNVNIQVWPLVTKTIVDLFSTQSNSNQIYNIISLKTNTFDIHYQPFIMDNNDHMYNLHCTKTLVQPNKKQTINCHKSKQIPHIQSAHKNNTSNLIDSCK
jgi:hypothetical protein